MTAGAVSMTMRHRLKVSRTCQYETDLKHLLRLCELALLEAQPVWVRTLPSLVLRRTGLASAFRVEAQLGE